MMHGLLLIDKPVGWTSHDVVAKLRGVVGQREIGHTGTLDPFASGLMLMVMGEATKISDYIRDAWKSYKVTLQLGIITDTLDRTGEILQTIPVDVSAKEIQSSAEELVGQFRWPVPIFSAKKQNGRRLADHARAGETVLAPSKDMHFKDVLVKKVEGDKAELSLSCSAGSFVRTWVDQLGHRLGCGATTTELRRTSTAGFRLEKAMTLETVASMDPREIVDSESFIPLAEALPELQNVIVKDRDEEMLANGTVSFDLSRRLNPLQREVYASGLPVTLKVLSGKSGRLLSLLEVRPAEGVRVRRVFKQMEGPLL